MSEHRYKLEPYKGMSTRYNCPDCNQKGKFARYIDTQTNQQLSEKVGKCERSDSCGYHYKPKKYFSDNGIVPNQSINHARGPEPIKPISFIDSKLMAGSLTCYEDNRFIAYLHTIFDESTVSGLIEKYKIGTSKHWPGSTVFWQQDIAGNIRTGKIMQYDSVTGKRIKIPQERIQWVHKVTKAANFNLKQCLFGEHLLSNNNLPVAVVESEKTAVIASGYLPQITWVASGNKQGLSKDKCDTLRANSKVVILYPDLNCYNDWNEKAKLYNFKISDLLEKKATLKEKENGLDIADYLTRFSVSDFSGATYTAGTLPTENFKKLENKTQVANIKNLAKPSVQPKIEKSILSLELRELHGKYKAAESNGSLNAHPLKSWIGNMWEGILMYAAKPDRQKYYIEQLQSIKL
jgi:hypothetical protein